MKIKFTQKKKDVDTNFRIVSASCIHRYKWLYPFISGKSDTIQGSYPNGKDLVSLEFPPSYSNFPMYHRNDKLLAVSITLIYLFKRKQYI